MDLLALLGALFGGTAIVAGFLLEGGEFIPSFRWMRSWSCFPQDGHDWPG